MTQNNLRSLPALARLPKKAKELRRCECGCQGLTQNRFVPGHDARLRGWMLRVERAVLVADGPAIAQIDWIEDNASRGEAEAVARALGIDWVSQLERDLATAEGMPEAVGE